MALGSWLAQGGILGSQGKVSKKVKTRKVKVFYQMYQKKLLGLKALTIELENLSVFLWVRAVRELGEKKIPLRGKGHRRKNEVWSGGNRRKGGWITAKGALSQRNLEIPEEKRLCQPDRFPIRGSKHGKLLGEIGWMRIFIDNSFHREGKKDIRIPRKKMWRRGKAKQPTPLKGLFSILGSPGGCKEKIFSECRGSFSPPLQGKRGRRPF